MARRLLVALVSGVALAFACSPFSGSGSDGATTSDGGPPPPGDDGSAPEAGDGGARDADASAPLSKYSAAVLEDGPSMYLQLDEPTGVAAQDTTGQHAATCVGDVERGVPGAFPGSLAVHFSGASGAQGGITPGKVFSFEGRRLYTLEVWARPTFDATYRYVLGNDDYDDAGRENYSLYTYTTGFTYERYVTDVPNSIGPAAATAAEYHHVVVTYDGTASTLYVDGAVRGTVGDNRPAAPKATQFFIGCGSRLDAFPFEGDIDEVAVYDKALSSTRVLAHFAAAR